MRCLVLVAALLAVQDPDFAEWKVRFNKHYESVEEETLRYEAFKANRAYVTGFNDANDNVELELNEFADLSGEEFNSMYYGLKPSLQQQWSGLPYLGTHEYSGAELADSIDWEAKGAVTAVKNQGQCGSCWSFSATGSLEGAWEIATQKLVSISEQQLVDCSKDEGNQGCQGGLMDNAFKYMEQNAMCTEDSYPYAGKNGKQCKTSSCKIGVPKGSVTGFKDVAHNDEQAMMEAVSKGPVSVAIEADKSVFQLYKKGVLTQKCGTQLDHGVLVVGYGTLAGQDYWKVKNSWGPSWGSNGYILLARGGAKSSQGGECGVLENPSYPIVKASESILI